MQFVQIAGSNVRISRIGFGCARLFAGVEARDSRRLIETALSVGIRHFDTAPAYGNSESILGEVLAGVPDVTVATKVGIPHTVGAAHNPARILYRKVARPIFSRMPGTKARLLKVFGRNREGSDAADYLRLRRQLTHDVVMRSLEESLRRLKRSRLEVLLIHEPDQFEIDDKLSELFDTLKHDAIMGAFGLAYGRVADMAQEFGTVLQSCYSQNSSDDPETRCTRILHGVLRSGWHLRNSAGRGETAGDYIKAILQRRPNIAVIFSASSRQQVRNVVGSSAGC